MWLTFILGMVVGGILAIKLWRLFLAVIAWLYFNLVSGGTAAGAAHPNFISRRKEE